MAEDVSIEQDEQAKQTPKKSRKRLAAIGVILGIMGLEALVIFVLVKSFVVPAPQLAEAGQLGGLDGNAGSASGTMAEVEVASFRALNDKSPRVVIYDVTIYAVVSEEDRAVFEEVLERRKQTVRDRFVRIVRGADPAYFQEPDLATLREQFKHELSTVAGESIGIEEVLLPSIIPYSDG